MELLKTDNSISLDAERKIIGFKEAFETMKQKEEEFKMQLLQEMKKRGITSYKDENLSISLISEGTKETFDSKSFKAKFPDIHKKYAKSSKVKEYAKITIKKDITSKTMIENINPEIMCINVVNSEDGATF